MSNEIPEDPYRIIARERSHDEAKESVATNRMLVQSLILINGGASNGLMSEHAFFEYRAKLMSTAHIEEQGEPIHCLMKMDIGADPGRSRELLEQEAGDLILFNVNPSHRGASGIWPNSKRPKGSRIANGIKQSNSRDVWIALSEKNGSS